jgi:hypothetical protein
VAELLGFGDGELVHAAVGEVFAEGAGDAGGGDEVAGGDVGVAVVLHHAGEEDVGAADAVEGLEVVLLEGVGELDGAVAAEVEEDDGVAVDDGAEGLAVAADDERGQVLVEDAGGFGAEGFDGGLAEG